MASSGSGAIAGGRREAGPRADDLGDVDEADAGANTGPVPKQDTVPILDRGLDPRSRMR